MVRRAVAAALGSCLVVAVAVSQAPPPGGPPPGAQPPGGAPPGGMPPMPSMTATRYQSALSITDGRVTGLDRQAISKGTAQATSAADLHIRSARENFNGVLVAGGRSAYTLTGATIRLSGPGSNDFLGIGAGAMVRDSGALVLDHVDIETSARVASAVVAAEESTLRVYDSKLVAHGGPLPPGYTPRIGPGMLEPPAPLGLSGTARTLLAMSNSRTFIYRTTIEADGWGALSTDATGGHLYLEANDSTVRVRGAGYGVYADFGSTVVLNRTQVDSGAYQGIIAGAARIDFNEVRGHAARSAVMIHSVMAFDASESAQLAVRRSQLQSDGPVFVVKSANAVIDVEGGTLRSSSGALLDVRQNDDPNATRTQGKAVPGVRLNLGNGSYEGAVRDTDPDRDTAISLRSARLTGTLTDITLAADTTSRWTATGDSSVSLAAGTLLTAIDAPAGVKVHARTGDISMSPGEQRLPSGGSLILSR